MAKAWRNPKTILVDADGVLLDWEWAFNVWIKEHGFEEIPGSKFHYDMSKRYGTTREQIKKLIRIFNESAAIGFLPALRDAAYYVKRLHEEHGYVFHCITSLSRNENAIKLREMNLCKVFGDTAFERVVCLDTGAHKDDALEEYEGSGLWWIEDKITNAEVGHEMGLKSVLMEHGHNMGYYHEHIRLVKNWREIYELLVSSS